jgi:hypothetical protein
MADSLIEASGRIVSPEDLKQSRAKQLVSALLADSMPYSSLVECRVDESRETVVFDLDVELSQIRENAICSPERIAVTFDAADRDHPEVVALRNDFPCVPHLNLRLREIPRSLCLSEQLWVDARLTWAAPSFVEGIRTWLTLTSRGELHQHDQPLEPLLPSSRWHLLIPAQLDMSADGLHELTARLLDGKNGRFVQVDRKTSNGQGHDAGIDVAIICLRTPPQCHGVIRKSPRTVDDLCKLAKSGDFSLLKLLRSRIRALPDAKPLTSSVLLIMELPKVRYAGGNVESTEVKAFWGSSLRDFGVGIGVWAMHEQQVSTLLKDDSSKKGEDIEIESMNVSRKFSWSMAAVINGATRNSLRVLAIGAGALGSQVMMNLIRRGWGQWTVVDNDTLLPHNLARHELIGPVGYNKAELMAWSMNQLVNDDPCSNGVPCDIIYPGDYSGILDQVLAKAEVVLDMSASVAVGRHLAHLDINARAVSIYLSPSGRDLVLLAEDEQRDVRLDHLEMIYYAALISDPRLRGHLSFNSAGVRYGASCRDVSSRMPHAWTAIHSGIAAATIPEIASGSEAAAKIWRVDAETSVSAVEIKVEPFVRRQQGDWVVLVAPSLVNAVIQSREEKLPRETGGILVGATDYDQKIVYLVAALLSPSDSKERPRMFIRGSKGLSEEKERIQECTAGHLDYVGEWHSHPVGVDPVPSADDRNVFTWVGEHLFMEGRPAVMMICGDGEIRIFIDSLDLECAPIIPLS